jgi:hypothetical protein
MGDLDFRFLGSGDCAGAGGVLLVWRKDQGEVSCRSRRVKDLWRDLHSGWSSLI